MLNPLDNHQHPSCAVLLQTRGISLGVTKHGAAGTILAASNTAEFWSVAEPELEGRTLSEILDISPVEEAEWRLLASNPSIGPYHLSDVHGTRWCASFTRSQGQDIVHLEMSGGGYSPDEGEALLKTSRYIDRINRVRDINALWSTGCEELRNMLRFDRSFVIELTDGGGEVVAESVRSGLAPVLGMMLDIPAEDQPFGVSEDAPHLAIYDLDEAHAVMRPGRDGAGEAWDLSHSPLRIAPPALRRMMVALEAAAGYVIAVGDEKARYLVVSLNAEPRLVDAFARVRTSMLAQLVFSRTRKLQQQRESERRLRSMESFGRFALRLRTKNTIFRAVVPRRRGEFSALDLVRADGLLIYRAGEWRTVGGVMPAEEKAILRLGKQRAAELQQRRLLKSDDVRRSDPKLLSEAPSIAGVLTTALGSDGGFITWIRRCAAGPALRLRLDAELADAELLQTDQNVDRLDPWTDLDEQDATRFVQLIEDEMLRSAEAALAELALVDSLTGLPNRRLLRERIGQALVRQQRGHAFLLAFIDLNEFKWINDTYGHLFGDDLLISIGQRLQQAVRASDSVARLGGDEFVVLLEEVDPGERKVILERLAECFAEPFVVRGRKITVEAAIGVAEAREGATVDSLLEEADVEMYEAKALMKSA